MDKMENAKEIKDCPDVVTDEKKLRKVSRETTAEECEALGLWDKLLKVLSNDNDGVGLAAIQIGYPLRAFMSLHQIRPGSNQLTEKRFVNPKILSTKGLISPKEGCLSFPGTFIRTSRHAQIEVEDDLNGRETYQGYDAVIIQHEIDHLDGVLMFERESKPIKAGQKIGRNQACPCGSGKKYKRCCLNKKRS